MNEIKNNIDYETFLRIISGIPSCIFFKDNELKYRFSTHFWEQLFDTDIVGKTELEIRKDKDNAIFAVESDKNILRTGKGCNYTIKSNIDNKISYLEIIKEPVFSPKGEIIGIVGLINDVTEKTVLQEKINELVTTDSLTGVFNRATGTEAIRMALEQSKENKAFCLLDINKFKHINDTYGHQVGDKVLKKFGKVLKTSVYQEDIVMRLGGDEFIIFLNNIEEVSQINAFVAKLFEQVNLIKIPEMQTPINFSMGINIVNGKSSFDSLYTDADKNMYEAKKNNKHFVIGGIYG